MSIKRLYNDCETTGTDPKDHGLIQWSAIVTIDGEVVDSLSIEMQPFPDDAIEDDALEANGITREDLLSSHRLTPMEGYRQIVRFLGKHVDKFNKKDKFFWIGYNAHFDADFTREFFNKNGDVYFGSWFWVPLLCVMVLAGYMLMKKRTQLDNFKLATVYAYLYPEEAAEYAKQAEENPENDPWHDAMFDIERTIDVESALRNILTGGASRNA